MTNVEEDRMEQDQEQERVDVSFGADAKEEGAARSEGATGGEGAGGSGRATGDTASLSSPDEALEQLALELHQARDRHLRLAAEFENYRKRTREELMGASSRAQATLVGSLLDVFDDVHRVQQVDPTTATVDSVLEGIALLERKLLHILAEAGMEILEPEEAPFDPETMEAVVRVPVEDVAQDDVVAQVLQRGVRFKGHLVRPARVAVRKVEG